MADWIIEPLEGRHRRDAFSCGKASLDDFLRSLVGQYEKRRLGRTYVAVRRGDDVVAGYYTLASGAVSFAKLPPASARKLPRHPVPVVLLARLAVDRKAQGRGLGRELLVDALHRCLDLSGRLGIRAVEVEALDADAKRFYERYGFAPLLDDAMHLFLPLATLQKARRP